MKEHFEALKASFEDPDDAHAGLPKFVRREFERFIICGNPEFGFIRMQCQTCQREHALPYSCKTRVLCPSCGARRMHDLSTHIMDNLLPKAPIRQWVISPPFDLAPLLAVRPKVLTHFIRCFVDAISKQMKTSVTVPEGAKVHTGAIVFVQRFTKSVTLFPHLHVLFLDGVYIETDGGPLRFVALPAPSELDLLEVGKSVFQRMEKFLKRHGYLNNDENEDHVLTPLEKWWLKATTEPSLLKRGPVANKIPFGANYGGFNIHAGVRVNQTNRIAQERLVRYVCRPPFSEQQLKILGDGRVQLELRSPTKAGQTSVVFEPVQFLRRLAWQIPPPKQNQVRYFGILGATHKARNTVVPRPPALTLVDDEEQFQRYRVPWAALIAKVFDVDSQICLECGGTLKPVGAVTKKDEAKQHLKQGIIVLTGESLARAPPTAA